MELAKDSGVRYVLKTRRFGVSHQIGTGTTFARNLREAFIMRDKHQQHLDQFSSTFPAEIIARWQEEVERWEADSSTKPNPFAEEITGDLYCWRVASHADMHMSQLSLCNKLS